MLSGMLGASKATMDADSKFMDDFKRAVLLEGGYVKSLGDEVRVIDALFRDGFPHATLISYHPHVLIKIRSLSASSVCIFLF